MNEIREQIILLRARSSYMSEAEPIDSAMHSDSADTLGKLLAVYEAAHVVVSEGVQHHMCGLWEAMNTLSTVVNDLVSTGQTHD